MKAGVSWVALGLALVACATFSQGLPVSNQAAIAGCYELSLSNWVSSNPRETTTPYQSYPRVICLVAQKGPGGPGRTCSEQSGGTVYPCNNTEIVNDRFVVGCWSATSDESLVIIWSNMMEYLRITLTKGKDSWQGSAATGGDAGPGAFSCKASLKAVTCKTHERK